MNARKLVLSMLALVATLSNLQAHALWIQTAPAGSAGKAQQIKITYAEPGENPEKLGEWYSDVKEFELWLTRPDGKKEKLTTIAGEDHFTSQFTPQQEGVYTLSVGHSAKELGGKTIYQFNASALVRVGKSTAGNEAALNNNDLSIFADAAKSYQVQKPLRLTTVYKSTPGGKASLNVSSPSGWSRQIETDENGMAEFTPLWPGTYYIEASKSWKESGTHNGKEYNGIWRAATLLVDVAK
ncbi:DUF4198 domain-containing protein [Dyadobacter sandarakinus]|uniref:DUF4198 domain-containing protein n=1 Tax=Dyadobacter sandarakinus TaxID=2747268 RepID=A0ABX7I7Y8_9BACT|nr:DUF4198 domain-containing protein [Dyadobacter sandarakinus]QRR01293.1 DUF4198 domain-containing protein [Dyadobacter sandarakinus]